MFRYLNMQRLGLWLALLLIITACSAPPVPSVTGTSVFFSDDFAVDRGDWTFFDTTEGAAYLQQNELFVEDRGQGIGIYTQLLERRWEDIRVNVRVRQIEGTQDNWMGLTCRQQDEENYYLFAVSADGYYLLLKVENGVATPLLGPLTAEAITPGRAANNLEVRCEDDTLALSVNDRQLAAVSDDTFAEGYLSLFADGVAGQRTTVAFDTLIIAQP
jgi:hypothetical protein